MNKKSICPVCGIECHEYRDAAKGLTAYECRVCGYFLVSDDCTINTNIANAMFYYLQQRGNLDKKRPIFVSAASSPPPEGCVYVREEDLIALYPKNFTERAHKSLLNLVALHDPTNVFTDINWGASTSKIYRLACFVETESNSEAVTWLIHLRELGYIIFPEDKSVYRIRANGWLKVQELEAQYKVIPQAFVAMWFDPSMDKAKEQILQAIKDSCYIPMIISDKEHNNQIVPEILYEIKQSQFVVADLTGQRGGVYYEAGYALGLNKEVICCCKESPDEKVHFDIAQKNMVFWKTPEELYEKLTKRIEATVGKANS